MEAEAALRKELSEIAEQAEALATRKRRVQEALRVLRGGGEAGKKGRTRTYRGSQPIEQRMQQVLDFLRANPHEKFNPTQVHQLANIPSSSTYEAVRRLVREKRVEEAGRTPSGHPIVKHKPVSVRPSEAVAA